MQKQVAGMAITEYLWKPKVLIISGHNSTIYVEIFNDSPKSSVRAIQS